MEQSNLCVPIQTETQPDSEDQHKRNGSMDIVYKASHNSRNNDIRNMILPVEGVTVAEFCP